MSLINIDVRRAAKTNVELELQQQVLTQPWRRWAGTVPTGGEKYIDLESLSGWDGIKEFIGERHYDDLTKLSYRVDTTKWEKSVEFDEDDMRSKAFKDLVSRRVRQLGLMFAQHPNDLFYALIKDRTSTNTIDGVTFFNAAHPVAGSDTITNSNIVSGSGTTTANIYANFISAELAFGAMLTRSGAEIWSTTAGLQYHVMYGPALHSQMILLFGNQPTNTSDPLRGVLAGRATIELLNRLDDNDWYVGIKNTPAKPFAYVEMYPPTFKWKQGTAQGDFETDKVRYGGKARYKLHHWNYPAMVLVNN